MDERGRSADWGAGAGVAAVGLFVAGALVIGERPPFDAPAAEIARHLAADGARVQVGAALDAAATPFLVWFLAAVWARARSHASAAVAFGCGVAYVAVFVVDVTALAVAARRAGESGPETTRLLVDFEWTAIGLATPLAVGMLAALAVVTLRHGAVWPRWVGWLALAAAAVHALRVGTVFTTDGPFAPDGALGLYAPVAALVGWLAIASVVLAGISTPRRAAVQPAPGGPPSRATDTTR